MKKFKLFLSIAFMTAVIFSSCDKNNDPTGNGSNSGSGSATFTLKGIGANPYFFDGQYWYTLYNYSSSAVTMTANGQTKTLAPYAPLTGVRDQYTFMSSNATISVTYSPANKVRYESADCNAFFYDK